MLNEQVEVVKRMHEIIQDMRKTATYSQIDKLNEMQLLLVKISEQNEKPL